MLPLPCIRQFNTVGVTGEVPIAREILPDDTFSPDFAQCLHLYGRRQTLVVHEAVEDLRCRILSHVMPSDHIWTILVMGRDNAEAL